MHTVLRSDTIPVTRISIGRILALLLMLAAVSGCRQKEPTMGTAAATFQMTTQSRLNRYCPDLARKALASDRAGIEAALATIYTETEQANNVPYGFLAVLDTNGVTLAATSRQESSGEQNYGHYQIISRVLQKRKILQSTLYMQGGHQVFIICAPLLHKAKAVGVLMLGIEQEYLRHAGITAQEFMAISFTNHALMPQ